MQPLFLVILVGMVGGIAVAVQASLVGIFARKWVW